LVEDLIGKGKSAAQQWLIPRAGKPAQLGMVGRDWICGQ
jgi:hypothetical protein